MCFPLPRKTGFWAKHMALEGNTLVSHSIISHGMHYLKNLGAIATYSASVVDCAIEVYL
jgi:hypothetical protein